MKKFFVLLLIAVIFTAVYAKADDKIQYTWEAHQGKISFHHVSEAFWPNTSIIVGRIDRGMSGYGVCEKTKIVIIEDGTADTLFSGQFNKTAEAVIDGKTASIHLCKARTMDGTTWEWISEIHAIVYRP
jgi:hypothetical protein